MPRPRPIAILLALLGALALGGCAARNVDAGGAMPRLTAAASYRARALAAARSATPAPAATTTRAVRFRDCTSGRAVDDAALAAAVERARVPRRFALDVASHGAVLASFDGVLDARGATAIAPRAAARSATSVAAIEAASTVRVVGDRVLVREGARWLDVAAAAGTTLDVGRELLHHRFLLGVAHRCGDRDDAHLGGTVHLAAFRQRADDHGDATDDALAQRVTAFGWNATLDARGELGDATVRVTVDRRLTVDVATTYLAPVAVDALVRPAGTTVAPGGAVSPLRLVALLTAAGRS